MVEQLKRDGGTVEQTWWNSGTDMVEQQNGGEVQQWNSYGKTVEKRWWNSGTRMLEKRNNDGGKVEQ